MRTTIVAFVAFISIAAAEPAVYKIDSAHSGVQFAVRHLTISQVRGQFGNIKGTVEYDPQNMASTKVQATIDVATIDTRQAKRDAHLKTADFFDAEKFPTIQFVSKRLMPAGPGKLKLLGDLTMHGVTREVTLDVDGPTPEIKDPQGNARIGALATTSVNRQEFGITYNRALEGGGLVISDEVSISIDLQLVKAK